MHRGDTEVQVWQWDNYPTPTSPRSILGVIRLSAFFLTFNLLTFTSCRRCLSITRLSITVFPLLPQKKIKYLFLLASVLCFPAHSLATRSSFPPFFLLCAFPSYLHVPALVLSLALIPFLFHLFTFSLLHPSLSKQNSLFRYPRPFLISLISPTNQNRMNFVLHDPPCLPPARSTLLSTLCPACLLSKSFCLFPPLHFTCFTGAPSSIQAARS